MANITNQCSSTFASGLVWGYGAGIITTFTAPEPKPGQILTALSSTEAVWLDPTSGGQSGMCVVSADGEPGTYPLLSAALADGCKIIYIKAGEYTETTQIVIPYGADIQGQNITDVKITFSGLSIPAIQMGDVSIPYSTNGSVSILSNSSTVNGVGTTFTTHPVGALIRLGNAMYTIASILSDTVLTIASPYRGVSLVGAFYFIMDFKTGATMNNITIINDGTCTSEGISLYGLKDFIFSTIRIHGFTTGLHATACTTSNVNFSCIRDSMMGGTLLEYMMLSEFALVFSVNNNGSGIVLSDAYALKINRCNLSDNNVDGLLIINTSDSIIIADVSCNANRSEGINVNASARNVMISNSNTRDNDIGILCRGLNSTITGCVSTNNLVSGIAIGTQCLVNNNIIAYNRNGLDMASNSLCSVVSNNINNNTEDGISVTGNSGNCTYIGNTIYNNGANGIYLNSSTASYNTLNSNTINNNGVYGIYIRSDNNVVNGNVVYQHVVGVYLTNQADRTIVTSNNLFNNTTPFTNNGTNTTAANNILV